MSLIQCPTCKKLFNPDHNPALPFCSVRCQQIDLGRWLSEEQGLPVVPDPDDDEQPESDLADERDGH